MTQKSVTKRDRYFDLLRVAAIARVVLFHAFPVAGLELVFPSMGVMFALGGSLMARSVDASAPRAVVNRLRRLLPALWAMALVVVPLMLLHGWPERPGWWRLLLWVVPVAPPPSNDLGYPAAGVLWYLVTYLWLVLLSPVLLRLYRRRRVLTAVLPLAGLALLVAFPAALPPTPAEVVQDVLGYATCWVLGFAHRDGDLRRLSRTAVLSLAALCVGGSLGYAAVASGAGHPLDLPGRPLAYAVYHVGFVLVLLRWSPRVGWLARVRPLDRFVTLVNNRAVTIYLWHNLAITVAVELFDPLKLWRVPTQAAEDVVDFGLALGLLWLAVLALGWVEDVAARRPPRISPLPPDPPPPVRAASAAPSGPAPVAAAADAAPSGPAPAADAAPPPARDPA